MRTPYAIVQGHGRNDANAVDVGTECDVDLQSDDSQSEQLSDEEDRLEHVISFLHFAMCTLDGGLLIVLNTICAFRISSCFY